jgi:hypothetical protein
VTKHHVYPIGDSTNQRAIDRRGASVKLDHHPQALIGSRIHERGAPEFLGRVDPGSSMVPAVISNFRLWLSTAWCLGDLIRLERTSRPARMSSADTINSLL